MSNDNDPIRSEIVEGFARALYACAIADACERIVTGDENGCPACGSTEREHEEGCEAYQRARELQPGPGGDWMDTIGETSAHARYVAARAVADIERRNYLAAIDLHYTIREASWRAEGRTTPDLFGHYLAMEWLGHGVSWADDHDDHGLDLGSGEYHVYDVRDPNASALVSPAFDEGFSLDARE